MVTKDLNLVIFSYLTPFEVSSFKFILPQVYTSFLRSSYFFWNQVPVNRRDDVMLKVYSNFVYLGYMKYMTRLILKMYHFSREYYLQLLEILTSLKDTLDVDFLKKYFLAYIRNEYLNPVEYYPRQVVPIFSTEVLELHFNLKFEEYFDVSTIDEVRFHMTLIDQMQEEYDIDRILDCLDRSQPITQEELNFIVMKRPQSFSFQGGRRIIDTSGNVLNFHGKYIFFRLLQIL